MQFDWRLGAPGDRLRPPKLAALPAAGSAAVGATDVTTRHDEATLLDRGAHKILVLYGAGEIIGRIVNIYPVLPLLPIIIKAISSGACAKGRMT
jgi:hypothetical protein